LGANKLGNSFARLYADSVSVASNRPKVSKLAKARLNQAVEYIDAGLAERMSLADISSAVGLRPMHFAEAATGCDLILAPPPR
jgi:hypothetical protein